MKVIVFGATGQLGCYSALALKKNGHEVVAVGRRDSDGGFFADNGIAYIGGVTLETEACFDKLPTDIDAVVNMAGTMPAHANMSPMPYVQSIVVGTVNLAEWMRTKTHAKRIVFNTTPSDVCEFFGKPIPIDDDAPRSFPKDGGDHAVYAICKSAAVDILEHYKYAYGFMPCVFRHFTVYGWHPDANYSVNGVRKVLPWRQIMRKCIAGDDVEVWGDPTFKKELLYIDDFTAAIVKAAEGDVCGLFNLSAVKHYTLEDQIQGMIEVFSPKSKTSKKIYRPDKPSTPQNILSPDKAKRILGWSAQVTWVEACKRMREEMLNNRFENIWGVVDPTDQISE